jgi:hypothetical protein
MLFHNRFKPAVDDWIALVLLAIGFLDHAVEISDAYVNDCRVNRLRQRELQALNIS